MQIGLLLLVFIGGGLGIVSSIYLLIGMPVILLWKIYRKIRYGISLYN